MALRLADGTLLFLDACCAINLLATNRAEEILRSLPLRFAVSQIVAEKEVRDIGTRMGQLEIFSIVTDEEADAFVRFALELDVGEASVCALALVHAGAVATDDRKALRILSQAEVAVSAIQTPELLFEWARTTQASRAEVGQVVRAITEKAHFHPRKDAPHFLWWASFTR